MMKIPKSIRDAHAVQTKVYARLKDRVDALIEGTIEKRWHYESRLKEIESFALKVETGRHEDPDHLEDFFACTIVVDNLSSIPKAESDVRRRFTFRERRPRTDDFTLKRSDSFQFDDIRLYVRWKDDPNTRPSGLDGLIFEVQIKTFLGHAWSIATHDLTYKADQRSWPRERIAFQIKAMLEHAEISILQAQRLATSACLNKSDEASERISSIIRLLNELWPHEMLPKDKKRLAENIDSLIENVGVSRRRLREILQQETRFRRGTSTLNLSPFLAIVQSLLNQETAKMVGYLTGGEGEFKLFVPGELDLPATLDTSKLTRAILYTGPRGD